MSMEKDGLAVVILAAGEGTRMKSPLAKVLHQVSGQPMLGWVLDAVEGAGARRTVVIVGHQKEAVIGFLGQRAEWVEQSPRLGTGHAVQQARQKLAGFRGDILVVCGDTPLLSLQTLQLLLQQHHSNQAGCTFLTALLDNPAMYGRIVRDDSGQVRAIVEFKDADERQRAIREINVGLYVFRADLLWTYLDKLRPNNVQKEYYLTDVPRMMLEDRVLVQAVIAENAVECLGINTPEELAAADKYLSARSSANR